LAIGGNLNMTENNHYEFSEIKSNIRNRILSVMFLSGLFQLITAAFIILFGMLPLIVFYDIFYWPPFLIFRLKEMPYWVTFGIILLILTGFQIILTIYWKIKSNTAGFTNASKFIIFYQFCYFPFGMLFGIYEYLWLQIYQKNEDLIDQMDPLSNGKTKKEMGFALIWTGIIYSGTLIVIYLLTVYLSTVMLDMTYPFLTMSVLYQIRKYLVFGAIYCGIQIIFGILYSKDQKINIIKWVGIIIGIIQIPLIPIGTIMGFTLLRDLKFKDAIN
jgi:hypothetical protein